VCSPSLLSGEVVAEDLTASSASPAPEGRGGGIFLSSSIAGQVCLLQSPPFLRQQIRRHGKCPPSCSAASHRLHPCPRPPSATSATPSSVVGGSPLRSPTVSALRLMPKLHYSPLARRRGTLTASQPPPFVFDEGRVSFQLSY
jgi:hypothetical protein